MSTNTPKELPLGTPPEFERMHRIIRRVCYVLLFALVIEGALTFPLLAAWYGVPELTPAEVCSELQKVMYDDETKSCRAHSFPQPPLRGPSENESETLSNDTWGVQPEPGYGRVEYRELIENQEQREADEDSEEDDDDG